MSSKKFEDLMELAKKLRHPESGCPWDRELTSNTSINCILEEAEELKEAIEKGDVTDIREELGDVVFCLALFIRIAEEEGLLNLKEVVAKAEEKIKRRHSWVFGEDSVETTEEALKLWKRNKSQEKGISDISPSQDGKSMRIMMFIAVGQFFFAIGIMLLQLMGMFSYIHWVFFL